MRQSTPDFEKAEPTSLKTTEGDAIVAICPICWSKVSHLETLGFRPRWVLLEQQ